MKNEPEVKAELNADGTQLDMKVCMPRPWLKGGSEPYTAVEVDEISKRAADCVRKAFTGRPRNGVECPSCGRFDLQATNPDSFRANMKRGEMRLVVECLCGFGWTYDRAADRWRKGAD